MIYEVLLDITNGVAAFTCATASILAHPILFYAELKVTHIISQTILCVVAKIVAV